MNTTTDALDEILTATEATPAAHAVARANLVRQQTGNALLDFDGPIHDGTETGIATLLEQAGVTEFTISSTYSNMTRALWAFQQAGWQITGMQEVASTSRDYETGTYQVVPAWTLTRN
jgi:hypothetical protein